MKAFRRGKTIGMFFKRNLFFFGYEIFFVSVIAKGLASFYIEMVLSKKIYFTLCQEIVKLQQYFILMTFNVYLILGTALVPSQYTDDISGYGISIIKITRS